MDTDIRHERHLHHRGPAHEVRRRRNADVARVRPGTGHRNEPAATRSVPLGIMAGTGQAPVRRGAVRSLRPAQEPEDSERGGAAGEQGLLFRGRRVATLPGVPGVAGFAACWLPLLVEIGRCLADLSGGRDDADRVHNHVKRRNGCGCHTPAAEEFPMSPHVPAQTPTVFARAERAVTACDLLLAVGPTLTIEPAGSLCASAVRAGAKQSLAAAQRAVEAAGRLAEQRDYPARAAGSLRRAAELVRREREELPQAPG